MEPNYALGGQEFSGRILAYRNCMSKSLKGNLEDPFQPGCAEPVHSPDIRGYQVRAYAEVRVLSGPHVGKKGWTSLILLVPSLIAKALDQ